MAAKGHFASIKDEAVRRQFDAEFLSLVKEVDYQIITVVIDKNQHADKYLRPRHPYHWGLWCMLERYCNFLRHRNSRGDVMAETRGKKEDKKLQDVFGRFYRSDSSFANSANIQLRLASAEIKFRGKAHLICGLELADLLALSSKIDVIHTYNGDLSLRDNFTTKVISSIQYKYYRGSTQAKGNGKKLLP